jgi:hypothetical protein
MTIRTSALAALLSLLAFQLAGAAAAADRPNVVLIYADDKN